MRALVIDDHPLIQEAVANVLLNHGITHNPLSADGLGSGVGDFVEECVPGRRAHARVEGDRGMAREGLECIDAEVLREDYAKTL